MKIFNPRTPVVLVLFFFFSCVLVSEFSFCSGASLKKYNIDTSKISVSGLSSGAFFAVQYHVAFSSKLMGCGVVAGGPYYCAEGNLLRAEETCAYIGGVQIDPLIKQAQVYAANGDIDALSNLGQSRVYLYSGTRDLVVATSVVKAAQSWYEYFIPTSHVSTEYSIVSEHCQPTTDYGNKCTYLGEPYINDCDYDAAGITLQWIYSNTLKNPTTPSGNASNILTFSQDLYTPSGTASTISMNTQGYLYVPTACHSNTTKCLLHISFHGCEQTTADIGSDWYTKTGFNEWAEANNIIVLYPQAKRSYSNPSNPNGCWDWWGYTNSNYAIQKGPQMATIRNMMKALTGI
eukprot:TRINITY_DN2733_c0_g1_i1.p1 TRINITY_DN2733_c0_g1~~TRINITY_DN2733_c0_g1_i1.p1  ORF type:complete len:347 (-),score=54.30 TRINITY_DN2733_c0_g1_i1:321-1361(-)